MTSTHTSATNRPSRRSTYRRLMAGSLGGGLAVGLALRYLDYPLLGEAVYWLGIVGFLAVWLGASVPLFDERDLSLERRASHLAMTVLAVALVLGASAARVLAWTGTYDVPAAVWGALYGYAAVVVVFAVGYLWLRYRP